MLITRESAGGREQYTPLGWRPLSQRRYLSAVYGGRQIYYAVGDPSGVELSRLLRGERELPKLAPPKLRGGGYSREDYEQDLVLFEQAEMALSAEVLAAEQRGEPLLGGTVFAVQAEINTLRRKAKARLLIGRMRAADKEWELKRRRS